MAPGLQVVCCAKLLILKGLKVNVLQPEPVGHSPNARIREFILNQFPLARKQQIRDSDPLLDGGMLDSLGVLDVVAFIEQEYSFTVADDDLSPDNFQSIDHIAAFIRSRTAVNTRPLA